MATNEITAAQRFDQRTTEKPDYLVSFDTLLAPGDTTASATVTELGGADELTISGEAVTTTVETINGIETAIGRAVAFFVTGGTPGADGKDYTLRVQSTAVSGAIRECDCIVRVIP